MTGGTPLHMFLRESTQKRVRGDRITYLQLAESVWNPVTQQAGTRILYYFGRTDDPQLGFPPRRPS
jgi:hypothetical protein